MKFKISHQIMGLGLVLVFLTSGFMIFFHNHASEQSIISSIQHEKEIESEIIAFEILDKLEDLKRNVELISKSSVVEKYIRSYHADDLNSEDHIENRKFVHQLFETTLMAHPKFIQIRIISLENGKEMVRLDRKNSKIVTYPRSELQDKSSEGYFKDIQNLEYGQYYLSDFEYNRENGKISYPIQAVVRSARPVYFEDSKPKAFVIINLEYSSLFETFKYLNQRGYNYTFSDYKGKVLMHSNPLVNLGEDANSENGLSKLIGKDYEKLKELKGILGSFESHDKQDIYVYRRIPYNPANVEKHLILLLKVNKKKIINIWKENYPTNYYPIFAISIISLLIAYIASRGITSPINSLIALASNVSKEDNIKILNKKFEDLEITGSVETKILSSTLQGMVYRLLRVSKSFQEHLDAINKSAIVAETDKRGKITYINDKFIEISKYSEDELLGKDHRILKSGEHSKDFFRNLWETILSGNVWKGVIKNKAKDGSIYWVDTTIHPVINENGEIEKFIALRFDITEKIQLLEEIEAAKIQTENALSTKSTFFANMSHEIRTPLNGILGYTDMLLDKKISSDAKSDVLLIKSCGQSLLTIINDILDISKIEAGKLHIENIPVDIHTLLKGAIDLFYSEVKKKGISIDFEIQQDVPQFISTDPYRLRQILLNLIGNAIKFTSEGGVTVKVYKRHLEKDEFHLYFEIIDTGIGIPGEMESRLFKSFVQADSGTTRKYGGTGLGLSICSNLAQLMGGKITVTSKEGMGSVFTFCILTKEENASKLNAEVDDSEYNISDLENFNILLVEDNPMNQKLAINFLKKLNQANITVANNGEEGVVKARESMFDIIFMDIQMPVMDGLEATKLIRNDKTLNYRPIIIGLSANVFEEDVRKGLDAGMDHYLHKPISLLELKKALFDFQSKKKNVA